MEPKQRLCLRIFFAYNLVVWWYPLDCDMHLALGLSQFGFRTMWTYSGSKTFDCAQRRMFACGLVQRSAEGARILLAVWRRKDIYFLPEEVYGHPETCHWKMSSGEWFHAGPEVARESWPPLWAERKWSEKSFRIYHFPTWKRSIFGPPPRYFHPIAVFLSIFLFTYSNHRVVTDSGGTLGCAT